MPTLPVVEVEIVRQSLTCLGEALIRMQIDVLVFDAASEPLDAEVHGQADRHPMRQNLARRPIENGDPIDEAELH